MTSTPNGNVQDSCAPTAEVYQAAWMPTKFRSRPDADAEHQARRHQAADHQIEDHAVAVEAPAEGKPGEERDHYGNDGDDHGELDRAVERALHVAGADLREQVDEPMQRQPLHREDQAAAHILERQDVDADHRPIECEHIKNKDREQHVEGPRPAAGARRDRMCGDRLRYRRRAHRVISLRTSTVRRMAVTISVTMMVSTTALAAAVGYCSTPTSS